MTITLGHFLALAGILFGVGLAGALSRRNAIIVLMGIEIMFNAAILNAVAFWYFRGGPNLTGPMLALFAIAVAAAESAVGLALVIAIYRHYQSVDVEEMTTLKG